MQGTRSLAKAETLSAAEPAPAKINLALHVTGRRKDGYHLIDSLVVFAAVGDVLRAVPGDKPIGLEILGPFADALSRSGPAQDNLVMRAAEALAGARRGRRPQTTLILDKRLPVASGIGGGSADAAAALRLLDRFWRLDLGVSRLLKFGAALGADVPMCLVSEPMRVTGIGEQLRPIAGLPSIPLLLVNPGVAVPTATVFGRLGPPSDPPMTPPAQAIRSVLELVMWLRTTVNGLTRAAEQESRLIARARTALAADPDCLLARMSGSGATCFGIFATPSAAERAAVRLRISQPDWWIAPTIALGSPVKPA